MARSDLEAPATFAIAKHRQNPQALTVWGGMATALPGSESVRLQRVVHFEGQDPARRHNSLEAQKESVSGVGATKPPRSRSSSVTRRNEVHFSSIPQLHSHPDDRFSEIITGEPYRPTSEHQRTPFAPKAESRVDDSGAADERRSQPISHKASVDLDSQLLTIPVEGSVDSKSTSEMEPPSRTPSLKSIDVVPPALVVTDALTPPRTEVGVQTGETIRLRQAMSFNEDQSKTADHTERSRLAPFGHVNSNVSFERFANNSFEKRGHPAPAVLTAMLQQRQNEAARRQTESALPGEATPKSGYRPSGGEGDKPLQREMLDVRQERKRSFIDNQHHRYETRTHQEWRSSTRSQWEDGKLDENYNELRGGDWTDANERLRAGGTACTVSDSVQQQIEKLQYSHLSDQVFEEREVIVERNEYNGGPQQSRILTVQQMQKTHHSAGKLDELPVIGSDAQRNVRKSQDSNENRSFHMQDEKYSQPNVISRKTVEQLRQSVMAESRPPMTPKGSSSSYVPTLTDIKDLSMTEPMVRGGSPYKWIVPEIDSCKEKKEADVRSNQSRTSSHGSTVRRHIPRGRIRDLARLFDGMSKQASRQVDALRGKSLPPPKHRSMFVRTHSLPRERDPSPESPPRNVAPYAVTEPKRPDEYPLAKGVTNSHITTTANQPLFVSSQRNSCSEPEVPHYEVDWRKPQQQQGNEMQSRDHDEASTDSRVDLRRTSTPLGSRIAGDLAHAFGRIPPIHPPESPSVYETRHLESGVSRNFNAAETAIVSDTRNEVIESTERPDTVEHHYAQPVVVKTAPAPHRLSVIHPNNGQHGYYVQHKRSQSDQLSYRTSANPDGEPIYAKVHRVSAGQYEPSHGRQVSCDPTAVNTMNTKEKRFEHIEEENVNGEIDRMFEFVDVSEGEKTCCLWH
ncbi:unnamed protein product [Heligmosomoides polygyrus]|uniref:HP domain-containing protein n=1 Tax=Heligmosomoides polygyrus TaxID=6339 RepID=A0A3P7Z646_HELPZ|nr:unnamed protein product [Heligmosomoides polygyrus]